MREFRLIAILLAAFVMLTTRALPAQGTAPEAIHDADLFFPGDSAYDDTVLGAIRAGKVPPTNAFPMFGADLAAPGQPLGQAAPSSLKTWISTPTLYYDTPASSTDIAPLLTGTSNLNPKTFPEFQHFLNDTPDPLRMEVGMHPTPSLAFRFDMHFNYRRDRLTGRNSSFGWSLNEWLLNLFGSIDFPRKAWVSFAGWDARSGTHAALALGRFSSGMGWSTLYGSLLNPRASWYDQARLSLGGGALRFTAMWATSSAQLNAAEREIQFRRTSDGGSFWDALNDHDFASADLALKLATWHQLEWRPAEWISLGLAEMSMIGGRMPSLDFVLPTLLWHNTYSAGYSNVAAGFNAAITPLPGLLVSGEFLVDDIRSYDEPSYAKPDSFAWNSSARWTMTPSTGFSVDAGAEYQHVDRWTYVRWQPYLAMYQRQTLTGGGYNYDQSLGAPWGPDHDAVGLYARASWKRGPTIRASYEFIRKGPIHQGMAAQFKIDDKWTWIPVYYDYDRYAGAGALDAIFARPDEYRNLVSLSCTVPVLPWLDARLRSTWGRYLNFGNEAGASRDLLLLYAGIVARL